MSTFKGALLWYLIGSLMGRWFSVCFIHKYPTWNDVFLDVVICFVLLGCIYLVVGALNWLALRNHKWEHGSTASATTIGYGYYNSGTRTVHVPASADLYTFLHEHAHAYQHKTYPTLWRLTRFFKCFPGLPRQIAKVLMEFHAVAITRKVMQNLGKWDKSASYDAHSSLLTYVSAVSSKRLRYFFATKMELAVGERYFTHDNWRLKFLVWTTQ